MPMRFMCTVIVQKIIKLNLFILTHYAPEELIFYKTGMLKQRLQFIIAINDYYQSLFPRRKNKNFKANLNLLFFSDIFFPSQCNCQSVNKFGTAILIPPLLQRFWTRESCDPNYQIASPSDLWRGNMHQTSPQGSTSVTKKRGTEHILNKVEYYL